MPQLFRLFLSFWNGGESMNSCLQCVSSISDLTKRHSGLWSHQSWQCDWITAGGGEEDKMIETESMTVKMMYRSRHTEKPSRVVNLIYFLQQLSRPERRNWMKAWSFFTTSDLTPRQQRRLNCHVVSWLTRQMSCSYELITFRLINFQSDLVKETHTVCTLRCVQELVLGYKSCSL